MPATTLFSCKRSTGISPWRWARNVAAVSLLVGLCGCSNPAEDSRQQMHKLQAAMMEYADKHDGQWPDSLEQIKDDLGGDAAFNELMTNPLTGEFPGYEYVKPEGQLSDSGNWQQVILYQRREGQRDTSLKVGYADGAVRPLDSP